MTEVLGAPAAALVALSAALATRDVAEVRRRLHVAKDVADSRSVEEILLQAHLFIGFPDVLSALASWRDVSGARASSTAAEADAEWQARGEAVCERVYGRNYSKLRANVAALSPDVDQWMVVGGYGRVIGRPGADLATRELCIVALLLVWNAPRQLYSHLRGALNAGATDAQVSAAIEVASELAAFEDAATARALWAEIRPGT